MKSSKPNTVDLVVAITSQQLHNAVIKQDWPTLAHIRYYEGDPGSVYTIESLNLNEYNLGDMPTDFLCFKHCKMKSASFSGKRFFPLSLWNCDARKLDLRNTSGMLFALNTDLSGALFDQTTKLVVENSDLPSAFKNCKMDDDFRSFLASQGVLFDFPAERLIESYAFGINPSPNDTTRLHNRAL